MHAVKISSFRVLKIRNIEIKLLELGMKIVI
jgi:hypothetical protein